MSHLLFSLSATGLIGFLIFVYSGWNFWQQNFLLRTPNPSATPLVSILSSPTPAVSLTPSLKPTLTPSPKPTLSPSTSTVTSYKIPVLVLKYFPKDPDDPTKIDRKITGTDLLPGTTIEEVRQKITGLTDQLAASLEKGSIFHGYKDTNGPINLDYSISEEKEFLKPVPVEAGNEPRPADHMKILKEEGFDICNFVETKGVKEVWLWMYHSSQTSPVESYQRGPYGGVGNGYMNLPLCSKTYTVYDYNYGRSVAEALEDHTHHFEALFRSIDSETWNKFVGGTNEPFACGWTHCPPNVMADCNQHQYDWRNETNVRSDCEDWSKERSGESKNISCHTWDGATCNDNGGVNFKIWWMQNLPKSWWEFIGDFDLTMKLGKKL